MRAQGWDVADPNVENGTDYRPSNQRDLGRSGERRVDPKQASGFRAGSAGNVAEDGLREAAIDTDVLTGDIT